MLFPRQLADDPRLYQGHGSPFKPQSTLWDRSPQVITSDHVGQAFLPTRCIWLRILRTRLHYLTEHWSANQIRKPRLRRDSGSRRRHDRTGACLARRDQEGRPARPCVDESAADVLSRLPEQIHWRREPTPSLGEEVRSWVDAGASARLAILNATASAPPLVDGDPEALPVLIELLQHERPKVRLLGACGLREIGPRQPARPSARPPRI